MTKMMGAAASAGGIECDRADVLTRTDAGQTAQHVARPVAAAGPAFAVRRWTRAQTLSAIGLFGLFWLVAASLWPLNGNVVPWDSKNHFFPMLRYLAQSIAAGEWPLWNPYHFAGHPTAADPQSLLFTPTMVAFAALFPKPSMEAFDVAVLAHLALGGLGVILLFRRRGWHWTGAVLAAVIFMLGGSASARLQHTGMIFSYAFLPVALFALDYALARRSIFFGLVFAVAAVLMALGRDQIAFLGCAAIIAFFLYQVFRSGRPLGYLRERALLLTVIILTGLGLIAVPALLTLQFLADSNRPSFGYGLAAMGSLPPSALSTLVAPNVFGSLDWNYDYWGPSPATMPDGNWSDRAVNYVFMGSAAIALILWLGVAGRRLIARDIRFYAAVGIVALIYALGRYTPIFERLFDLMPGVDLYRRPADATFIINLFGAIVAGYLLHSYVVAGLPNLSIGSIPATAPWPRAFALAAIAAALAALASMLIEGVRFSAGVGHRAEALRETAIAIVTFGFIAVLLVIGNGDPKRRVVAALTLALLSGGELVWRNAGSSLNAETAKHYAIFETMTPDEIKGLAVLRKELDERHAKGERPRLEIIGLQGAWQNASMVLGLEDTVGYNPLRIADYERAVGPGENAVDLSLRHFPHTFRGYKAKLASLLGLEYLVLDRPIDKLPKHFPRVRDAVPLFQSDTLYIYKLKPAAPRAYFATQLVPVDSESVLDGGDMPEFNRTEDALIDKDSIADLKGDYGVHDDATEPGADPSARVKIVDYKRNSVTLEVEHEKPGVVVLHDLYYPGWVATVDGVEVPILRLNLLFRGVEVPIGKHRVEFRFRPLSFENLASAARMLVARHDQEQ